MEVEEAEPVGGLVAPLERAAEIVESAAERLLDREQAAEILFQGRRLRSRPGPARRA
ncbi:MAG TPA: hypothetical protein VKH46_11890 [Thermoanaerobaculia bacterium]|nr:hypothetical protein [Thermoanaerobaculia bacterium]